MHEPTLSHEGKLNLQIAKPISTTRLLSSENRERQNLCPSPTSSGIEQGIICLEVSICKKTDKQEEITNNL